jgi:nitronate monooxygenase
LKSLQELLGIDYPIIQAPMAGSDNAKMVAAACEAGVLGSLGAQYRKPDEIRAVIREIRSLTSRPFAVNLFALGELKPPSSDSIKNASSYLQPYYSRFGVPAPSVDNVQSQIDADLQLQVLLDERVPVFSFTLGVPSIKWIGRFKSAGTILVGTATNVHETIALAKAGADAVVAQGIEAGGHRGTFIGKYEKSMIGSMALLPQLVDAVDVPIIAAGGIMDGRGIAAALALGASGVQLGTAFLCTAECPVHDKYKDAIASHEADETMITKVFSGGAARGIANRFIEEQSDTSVLPFPFHNALTRPIRKVANETGEIDYTNLWCGQAGKLARRMTTVELVRHLVTETDEVLAKMASRRITR